MNFPIEICDKNSKDVEKLKTDELWKSKQSQKNFCLFLKTVRTKFLQIVSLELHIIRLSRGRGCCHGDARQMSYAFTYEDSPVRCPANFSFKSVMNGIFFYIRRKCCSLFVSDEGINGHAYVTKASAAFLSLVNSRK